MNPTNPGLAGEGVKKMSAKAVKKFKLSEQRLGRIKDQRLRLKERET